jgi:NADPH oxidase
MCNTTACYEWFAHMLQEIELNLRSRPNFLSYNIYLTQWSMTQARAVIKNDRETRDIWTGLQSKTQYGRPNFEADFQAIIDEDWNIKTRRDIGVFVCGPEVLAKQLQQICIKMNDSSRSQNRARFYLNKENF